jgi:hypothetical protein
MGERYLVTGVQLGMLIEFEKETRKKLVDEIIESQFIENSEEHINQDSISVLEYFDKIKSNLNE